MYRWRIKYGGLETSELQRLRELEAENSRLKKIVAQQVLDMDALKEFNAKNGKPSDATPSRPTSSQPTRVVTTPRVPPDGCPSVNRTLQKSPTRG